MISLDHSWIVLLSVLVVVFSSLILFYRRQLDFQRDKRSEFDGKSVLVVTAHPDDECMFFSPTIINLQRLSKVHLLCLSTGNFYKQGSIRKEELLSSCSILGIPPKHVTVVNHGDLPDDPKADWDTQIGGQIITEYIKHNQIQVVITFDSYGVSGHTNHIAIFKAIKILQTEELLGEVNCYVLTSVGILRKYISLFDLPLSVFSQQMFLLSPQDMILAQKAMYAHKSQLLWFRRLYIVFSRFMLINTLEELK